MLAMFPTLTRAPADFGGASPTMEFIQTSGDLTELPKGFDPSDGTFERQGPDLMITDTDGNQVLIADYFMQEHAPDLVTTRGAKFDGSVVERLAGGAAPAQVAGEVPAPAEPIGKIVSLDGEVTVIRADGSRGTLQMGDQVLMGDILETGDPGGVGVVLADGTALSMGTDAKLILD